MITQNQYPEDQPITGLCELFRRVNESTYYVLSPCILTKGNLLIRNEVYELHYNDKNDVAVRFIKLLWVYLIGLHFYVIGVDVENGELVRCSQRLDAPSLPCSFLLADTFYFVDKANEMSKEIKSNEK
jgi:hypothetical protein